MIEIGARLVVDASALGVLFFREPDADFVEQRLSNVGWVAPSLLDYEMGSIFLKKMKRYTELRPQLEACYQLYCQSAIERIDVPVASVVPIAEKHGLTVYDASYFWLASTIQLELFTFDKALSAAWMSR